LVPLALIDVAHPTWLGNTIQRISAFCQPSGVGNKNVAHPKKIAVVNPECGQTKDVCNGLPGFNPQIQVHHPKSNQSLNQNHQQSSLQVP